MGPVENLCNQFMSGVATITGDSNRATFPYYRYGYKFYSTNESTPPQIRIKKTLAAASEPMIRGGIPSYDSTTNLSGSIGTWDVDLEISVWARDEEELFNEIKYFGQAINLVKQNNVEGITQPPIQETFRNLTFIDVSSHDDLGELATFNYTVKVNIAERNTDIKLISSSLNYISQSSSLSGSLSGSIEGSKYFVITSSI
jgi:hypothetical protein